MKKSLGDLSRNKFIACSIFLPLVAAGSVAHAAPLQEAHVSHVIQDVRLLTSNAAPRPASVNDDVREGTAVRTGGQSRAELTFTDLTITRIGENTVFSFAGGSREVKLDSGAILLQVPQGGEAAKIRTAAVTASITGGTGLMNSNKGYPTKLYILEGKGELCVNSGECATAHGGEMVMEDNGQLSKPVKFNAKLLFKTSPLLTDFPALPNEWLIFEVFNEQGNESDGSTPPQKDPVDIVDQKESGAPTPNPSQPPSGSPGKFGPPTTITSPDPYVINSGTQINTDPTITTNGVTDQGKLYRGNALDGSPIQYLFGQAPTAFDQMVFDGPVEHVPIAVFKFAHLQLTGDPTITIPSGATTFLALVSVGDITSGGPGGTLTFAGITRLNLITQAGSITLGPEISFANLSHLEFYARGAGSNLALGSAISNVDVVKLYAGGSVQVNGDIIATSSFVSLSAGDFLAGSGIINAPSIDIESLANVNIDGLQFRDVTGDVNGVAGATFNLTLYPDKGSTAFFPGTSFTVQGNTINVQTTGGIPTTFDLTSADFSFTAGSGGIQASTILFANGNSFLLQTTNGGDINIYGRESPPNGIGGNFSVGTIDAAGAVNSISGITNVHDLSAGTSISVGGDLGADTVTAGTTIDVAGLLASLSISAGGDITAGTIEADIDNSGGNINGNATASVTADNVYADGDFDAIINNVTNGTITGNALVDINVLGDLVTGTGDSGNLTTTIYNYAAGAIGGNAAISVAAANIFVQGDLYASIENSFEKTTSGTIGGNADINIAASGESFGPSELPPGSIYVPGAATLQILNNDGGVIGGTAGITVATLGDFYTTSVFSFINNRNGGSIGSDVNMTFELGGTLITSDYASFIITNRNDGGGGGTMGSDVVINLSAGRVDVGGYFIADISTNTGGHIVGNSMITVGVAGDFTVQADMGFEIENSGFDQGSGFMPGGTIGGDATISVSAANLVVNDETYGLNTIIANAGGGTIHGNAGIDFNVSGDITVQPDAFFDIANTANGFGTPAGTIDGDATIHVAAANISVNNVDIGLESDIDNSSGGAIGGNAMVTFDISGNVTSQSDAFFGIYNDSDGKTSPGTINGDATITLTANDVSANNFEMAIFNAFGGEIDGNAKISLNIADINLDSSLYVSIDNFEGTIGGQTSIDMNVSGDVTVAGDATVSIDNSVGSATAPAFPSPSTAIHFNGGNYGVGGTFLSTISGDGTIAFNDNTNVHADVLKVGVFGTNGTLTIGGGSLSADSVLKLYAPGSNGTLHFTASVTLSSGTAMHLAANTITIDPTFTVTINGDGGAANIYTNNPNYNFTPGGGYTGPPPNPSNGSFGGNGALDPVPLGNEPTFGAGTASSANTSTGSGTSIAGRRRGEGGITSGSAINVNSSGQLLSLLDTAVPGPGGTVKIPAAGSAVNSGKSIRQGSAKSDRRVQAARRAQVREAINSVTGKVNETRGINLPPVSL